MCYIILDKTKKGIRNLLSIMKFIRQKYKLIILIALTVAVTAFIWNNSTSSIEESKEISGGIMNFIKGIIDPENAINDDTFHVFIRKAAHFIEFFVLAALYFLIRENSEKFKEKLLLLSPFASLLTAVIDEYIQSFTGRGTQVQDVLIDFAGALCGIAFMSALLKIKHKINN